MTDSSAMVEYHWKIGIVLPWRGLKKKHGMH